MQWFWQFSTVTLNGAGITRKGSSLALEAATEINHKFKLDAGKTVSDYRFYVDGKEITTSTTGTVTLWYNASENIYVISIKKIAKLVSLVKAMYLDNRAAIVRFGVNEPAATASTGESATNAVAEPEETQAADPEEKAAEETEAVETKSDEPETVNPEDQKTNVEDEKVSDSDKNGSEADSSEATEDVRLRQYYILVTFIINDIISKLDF